MSDLMRKLREHDVALWHRVEELELKPQFYAFRWITLLLSQEFPLPGESDSPFCSLTSSFCLVSVDHPPLSCKFSVPGESGSPFCSLTSSLCLMGHDWASEHDSPLARWVLTGLVNMTVHLPDGS